MLWANETNTHDWSTRRRTAAERALRGELSTSELIVGRTLSECAQISVADLVDVLEGVPPDRADCPSIALQALNSLLHNLSGESPVLNSDE